MRLREGEALLRSEAPSTTRPSWRYAERGQRPNAGGTQTRANEQAQEHLATATTMYREMDMRFWLEQAEAEMRELA